MREILFKIYYWVVNRGDDIQRKTLFTTTRYYTTLSKGSSNHAFQDMSLNKHLAFSSFFDKFSLLTHKCKHVKNYLEANIEPWQKKNPTVEQNSSCFATKNEITNSPHRWPSATRFDDNYLASYIFPNHISLTFLTRKLL